MSEKEKFEQEEKRFEDSIQAKIAMVVTGTLLGGPTLLIVLGKIFTLTQEMFAVLSVFSILLGACILILGFTEIEKQKRDHLRSVQTFQE